MKLSTIIRPFASAATVLLVILAALEYLRPRFVSLFLDFRLIVGVVLVLWVASVATEDDVPRPRFAAALFAVLALALALPILYRTTAPFGKLGLAVLVAGALALVIVCVVSVKRPAAPPSDDSSSL